MNAKRMLALLLALVMVIGLAACGGTPSETTSPVGTTEPAGTTAPATDSASVATYIPAPYTVNSVDELTAQFLEPKYYENENGPTIGVTLLGVIELDGQYFRDLNNNKELDTFEDWRLDADTRAKAFAAAMTDEQLIYQQVNSRAYSANSTKTADVVDENGNPVWLKLFNVNVESRGGANPEGTTTADIVKMWDTEGFRSFVMRTNPDVEVGVWFNNGMEQYAEYDAIVNGEVAVPYLCFVNPQSHGMPGTEGVAAAVQGDGNASLVLEDATYDRLLMYSKGIDGIYGPQIDLVTDPRWSRNSGTYGENENVASMIAAALVAGYQNGTDGLVDGSVLVTVKHFPGDGAAFNGFESHGQTGRYRVYTTENSLADYQLKPFIAAFEAGAAGVMPGYSQPIIDDRIAEQKITYNGKTYDIKLEGRGNAFNEDVLLYLLREVLGFDGLINSDSLSVAAQQGVEDLSNYERMVLFIKSGNEAGVINFVGGGDDDTEDLLTQAMSKGDITRADLEATAAARAKVQIKTGNMDNPYRDLADSVSTVNDLTPGLDALVAETHLKSVVLMKNADNTLPLKDTSKKVYVHGFNQKDNYDAAKLAASMEAEGFTVVEDYNEADIAYLYVTPTIVGTGKSELAILDLGQDIETPIYDNNAKRTEETALVTTVLDMDNFKKIADTVHANGGKVIGRIEATNAWILTNMEPYCDALVGTFSTSDTAVAQVLTGEYNPTGKLPITMVADASVIALVETTLGDGETWDICVSPNDVPGYVKDQYMSADVLAASPSGSYAYKDSEGNFYFSGFGLSY